MLPLTSGALRLAPGGRDREESVWWSALPVQPQDRQGEAPTDLPPFLQVLCGVVAYDKLRAWAQGLGGDARIYRDIGQ